MSGEPDDGGTNGTGRIADELERARPSWMVLFGGYSRGFRALAVVGPAALISVTGILVTGAPHDRSRTWSTECRQEHAEIRGAASLCICRGHVDRLS